MAFRRRLGKSANSVTITEDGCKIAVSAKDWIFVYDASGKMLESIFLDGIKELTFLDGKLLVLKEKEIECFDGCLNSVWIKKIRGRRIKRIKTNIGLGCNGLGCYGLACVTEKDSFTFYDTKGYEKEFNLDDVIHNEIVGAIPYKNSEEIGAIVCLPDRLACITADMNLEWNLNFDFEYPIDIAAFDKNVVCISERVACFVGNGKLAWMKRFDSQLTAVSISDRYILIGSDDGIYLLDIYGNIVKRLHEGKLIRSVSLSRLGWRYAACFEDAVVYGSLFISNSANNRYYHYIVEEKGDKIPPIILTREMIDVAEEILSKCNSDEEIAKEIYLYVRNRIKYRKKLHINSTEETFRAGLGNCVETAMLYIALARYLGLEAGYKYSYDHACAWVNVDGKEVQVDCQALSEEPFAGFGVKEEMNYLNDEELANYVYERNLECEYGKKENERTERDTKRTEVERRLGVVRSRNMVCAQGRKK
ncbi:MAG: transglutaminase domain-containing protein [Thermoplasmata archaeon]